LKAGGRVLQKDASIRLILSSAFESWVAAESEFKKILTEHEAQGPKIIFTRTILLEKQTLPEMV
jgi:hypothetical protein